MPQIAHPRRKPDEARFLEVRRVRPMLDEYVERWVKDDARGAIALARYDSFALDRYPGAGELLARLKTDMAADDVRALLRQRLLARLAEDAPDRWITDLESDVPLQAAVADLLERR